MQRNSFIKTIAAISLVASSFSMLPVAAHAGGGFAPPGIEPCFNLGNAPCPPSNPGGLVNPPTPPGPGGGGGFGAGFGAGIGLGVGLGIINSLNQPRTVVVQPQQPTYIVPAPQAISVGLSPHDQYCLGKYNSYSIQTKRYLSFSGKYKLCISPFM